MILQVGDWSTRKQRRGRKDVSDMFKATQKGCCRMSAWIHISHSTLFPSSLHTVSTLRAAAEFLWSVLLSPRGAHIFTGAGGSKSTCSSWIHPAERGQVYKWVHTSCSLGSRRQSWQESSVRTTPKSHREEQSVRISWSTAAADDTGEKEAA